MRYDDPSICQVFGACLPIDTEPLILVREYFKFGPLDAFLRDHKQQLKVLFSFRSVFSKIRDFFRFCRLW